MLLLITFEEILIIFKHVTELKIGIYIVSLIGLLLLHPGRVGVFNSQYNFTLSIVYSFILIYFLYQQKKRTKNWFRFDVLFLIGYSIVHFQIPFLESIGIEPNDPNFIWINKNIVNYATWMSTVSINIWMLGFTLVRDRRPESTHQTISKINYIKYDLLLLIVFVIYLSLVGKSIFVGTYEGQEGWGKGASHVFLLFSILLYLRIIYFVRDIGNGKIIFGIIRQVSSNKIFASVLFFTTFLFFNVRG